MHTSIEGSGVSCPMIGEHLVDGLAAVHGALLGMRTAQEHRGRSRMIRAGVRALAARHRVSEVGDDVQAVAEFLERLQRLGELEAAAFLAGVHLSIVAPCGWAAEAALRERRGVHQSRAGRNHRVEQRQRERHTHPLQECATR